MKVFKCNKCGNLIYILDEGKGKISCCGEEMVEVKANTVDAAKEKHIPSCEVEKGTVEVTIGEVIHPMDKDHYIEFVIAEYKDSMLKYDFVPGMDPICYFDYEKGMKIYAYCNKHGLWMKEL